MRSILASLSIMALAAAAAISMPGCASSDEDTQETTTQPADDSGSQAAEKPAATDE